jgi:hypothetical protein
MQDIRMGKFLSAVTSNVALAFPATVTILSYAFIGSGRSSIPYAILNRYIMYKYTEILCYCLWSWSHVTTDGQSANTSWCRALCGAPSLTRGRVCLCYFLSQSESHFTADSQSVSQYALVSSPLCGRLTRYRFLFKSLGLEFVLLSLWGALSDKRPNLPFLLLHSLCMFYISLLLSYSLCMFYLVTFCQRHSSFIILMKGHTSWLMC